MSRVVIAGAGTLGHTLAARLASTHQVRAVRSRGDFPPPSEQLHWFQVDLSTVHGAEVALAGAETVVLLAQARRRPARLQRAALEDIDLLIADSVARAVKQAQVKRVLLFECGSGDVRRALLEKSGVPVEVLTGGGPDPVEHLVAMVNGAQAPAALPWTGALPSAGKPRLSTCSVQRVPRRQGQSAEDVASAYFEWLPRQWPGLSVAEHAEIVTVRLLGVPLLILRRVAGRSEKDITYFHVAGGALSGRSHLEARFEVRTLLDGETTLLTLTGFEPSLPWPVYVLTQAVLHERVMRRFVEQMKAPLS